MGQISSNVFDFNPQTETYSRKTKEIRPGLTVDADTADIMGGMALLESAKATRGELSTSIGKVDPDIAEGIRLITRAKAEQTLMDRSAPPADYYDALRTVAGERTREAVEFNRATLTRAQTSSDPQDLASRIMELHAETRGDARKVQQAIIDEGWDERLISPNIFASIDQQMNAAKNAQFDEQGNRVQQQGAGGEAALQILKQQLFALKNSGMMRKGEEPGAGRVQPIITISGGPMSKAAAEAAAGLPPQEERGFASEMGAAAAQAVAGMSGSAATWLSVAADKIEDPIGTLAQIGDLILLPFSEGPGAPTLSDAAKDFKATGFGKGVSDAASAGMRMQAQGARFASDFMEAKAIDLRSATRPSPSVEEGTWFADDGIRFKTIAADITRTGTQLGAQISAGVAATALTANPIIGVAVGAGLGAASDTGSVMQETYQKLVQNGTNPVDARATAANVGLVYAPISTLLEYIPMEEYLRKSPVGKAATDKLTEIAIQKAMKYGTGATKEGLTEAAQEVWQDFSQWAIANDKEAFEGGLGRYAKAGTLGAIVGGAANVITSGFDPDTDVAPDRLGPARTAPGSIQQTPEEQETAAIRRRLTVKERANALDQWRKMNDLTPENSRVVSGENLDPAMRYIDNLGKSIGVDVVFVDTGGLFTNAPAASSRAGMIVIDTADTATEAGEKFFQHEVIHEFRARMERTGQQDAYQKLIEAVRTIAPDTFEAAKTDYAARAKAAGLELTEDTLNEEGIANIAENLAAGFLRGDFDEAQVQAMAQRSPNLVERLISAGQRALQKFRLFNGQTLSERIRGRATDARLMAEYRKIRELMVKTKDLIPVAKPGPFIGLASATAKPQTQSFDQGESIPLADQPDIIPLGPDSDTGNTGVVPRGTQPQGFYPIAGRAGQDTLPLADRTVMESDTYGVDPAQPLLPDRTSNRTMPPVPPRPQPAQAQPTTQAGPEVQQPANDPSGSVVAVQERQSTDRVTGSRAELLRRIKDLTRDDLEATDPETMMQAAEQQAGDGEYPAEFTTSFAGPIPAEVKDALQGKFNLMRFVKANVPNGRGADSISALGVDRWVQLLESMNKGTNARALDAARNHRNPTVKLLAHLYDNAARTRTKRADGTMRSEGATPKQPVNVSDLPMDSEFTINGERIVVMKDENDDPTLFYSGGKVYAPDVGTLQVDRGSLRQLTEDEATQEAMQRFSEGEDGSIDLPFALRQMEDVTQTPAFKRWFSGSKIVDQDGNPLRVYHGNNRDEDFEVFEPVRDETVYRLDGQEIKVLNYYDHDYDPNADWTKIDPEAYHFGAVADLQHFGSAEEALQFRTREQQRFGGRDSGDRRHINDLRRMIGKTLDAGRETRPTGDGSWFAPNTGYSFIDKANAVFPVYLSIKNPIFLDASAIESAGRRRLMEKYKAMGYDGAIFTNDPNDLTKAGWHGHSQIVAFYPHQVKSAISNRGTFDPTDPNILFALRAHHGTPHTFEPEPGYPLGRFRLDKIGTGEGAQAYGWGLYFAGEKEVAEYYKKNLSRTVIDRVVFPDGSDIDFRSNVYKPEYREAYSTLLYTGGDIDKAIKNIEGEGEPETKTGKLLQSWKDAGARVYVRDTGRLYEVNLKPDEDEYLLWDKPLSEQSQKVKDALLSSGEWDGTRQFDTSVVSGKYSGESLYKDMSERYGQIAGTQFPDWMRGKRFADDRAASMRLRSLGIRGIKYLDGSSRLRFVVTDQNGEVRLKTGSKFDAELEAAKGLLIKNGEKEWTITEIPANYNYVIFDDADVDIEAMYALRRSKKNNQQQDIPFQGGLFRKEEYGTGGTQSRLFGAEQPDPLPISPDERMEGESLEDYKLRMKFREAEKNTGTLFALRKQDGTDRNLVVMHNLTADNLRFTDELGGMIAMPSVAVASTASPLTGFGEISLIARKDLIDPKASRNNRVFDTDVYSPRYPSASYRFKQTPPIWKSIEQWIASTYGDLRSPTLKAEDYDIRSAQYGFAGHLETNSFGDRGISELYRDGALQAYYAGTTLGKVFKNTDTYEGKIALRDEIAANNDAFEQWVRDNFAPHIDRTLFRGFTNAGNRRYAPYTIENVMQEMRKQQREEGGESTFYGAGSIRAKVAKRYRSIAQIQKDRGRIVPSGPEIEATKSAMNDWLQTVAGLGRPAFDAVSERDFGYTERFWSAVFDAREKGRGYVEKNYGIDYDMLPWKEINQFLDHLRDLPTEYFEAKINRLVGLGEFSGAVIPDSTPADVRGILAKYGINDVVTYPKSDNAARTQALASLADRQDAAFALRGSMKGDPRVRDFKQLQAQAMAQKPGQQTIGRPDLANPGQTDQQRRLVNAADELRKSNLPNVQKDEQVFTEADSRLSADKNATKTDIMRKVRAGELLDSVETVIGQKLVSDAMQSVLKTGKDADYLEAIQIHEAYRLSGTDAARAFRLRADRVETPAQRNARFLGQLLAEPDSITRKQIDNARQKMLETTNPGQRAGFQQTIESLQARQAQKAGKIVENLQKAGIDPSQINDQTFADPIASAKIARVVSSTKSGLRDKVSEYWINAILSAPTTQVANITGNLAYGVWENTIQRAIEATAADSARLVGVNVEGATLGEFRAMAKASGPAFRRAARNFLLAWQTEQPQLESQVGAAREDMALFGPGTKLEQRQGRVAIGGTTGRVVRAFGTRQLLAFDEFFKGLWAETDAHARAYRIATSQGLTGEARWNRVGELTSDLGSQAWEEAVKTAEHLAFQDENEVATTIVNVREKINNNPAHIPIGTFILPFVKTPLNIAIAAGEKTPLASLQAAYHLLTGKYKASPEQVIKDVANNLVGWGVFALLAAMVDPDDDQPWITGATPTGRGEREMAYRVAPPMSVKIGDQYVSYARIEPFATALGLMVDSIAKIKRDGPGEGLAGVGATLAAQLEDKTFLTGLADIFEAAQQAKRGNATTGVATWAKNFTVSWVPNIARKAAQATDPMLRERRIRQTDEGGVWSSAMERVGQEVFPLGSIAPPPKVDLWGREISSRSLNAPATDFAYRLLIPAQIRETDENKIDALILRFNATVPDDQRWFPTIPNGNIQRTVGGQKQTYRMTDEEYNQFLTDSGRESFRQLNTTRLNWDNPTQRDIDIIKKVLEANRSVAREKVLKTRQ